MDIKSLTLGDSIAGLLVDEVEETLYIGATLKLENAKGVFLEIPYIDHPHATQFQHVSNDWFRGQNPPRNLILQTIDGSLGLFGNQWRSHRSSTTSSLGTVTPSELLIGEYRGDLAKPLLLDKVRSRIDGLSAWTSLSSIETEGVFNDQGLYEGLKVTAKTIKSSIWAQGDASMRFEAEWRSSRSDPNLDNGLNIDEGVVLVSEFPTPRPFSDHLEEQRKVLYLLTLIFGLPLHFREHKVSSEDIVQSTLSGVKITNPDTLLISSATVQDYDQPTPAKESYRWALAHFGQFGTSGLESWNKKYDEWGSKFILPSVAILSRDKGFAEQTITTLSMAIEAAGHLLGKQPGEELTLTQGKKPRPSTVTHFYRCLAVLDTSWGDIASSREGLARGLAEVYNATKHFNKNKYPAPEVLMLVSEVLRYLVRLLALHLADESGKLLDQYRVTPGPYRLAGWHRHFGVSFDDDGKVVPYV